MRIRSRRVVTCCGSGARGLAIGEAAQSREFQSWHFDQTIRPFGSATEHRLVQGTAFTRRNDSKRFGAREKLPYFAILCSPKVTQRPGTSWYPICAPEPRVVQLLYRQRVRLRRFPATLLGMSNYGHLRRLEARQRG